MTPDRDRACLTAQNFPQDKCGAVRSDSKSPASEVPYGLDLCRDGELLSVTSLIPRPRYGGGRRGVVTVFSRQSRLNAIKKLGRVDSRERPLFCTLTYPDLFPVEPRQWANDLGKFLRRLARRFPGAGYFWVREMQRRKSGKMLGELAPHYHLLIWGVSLVDARSFFPQAWFESVASGDSRHLRAGTDVQGAHRVQGLKRYVSKYITKAESKDVLDAYPDGTGRWWGANTKLPLSRVLNAKLDDRQRDQVARCIRRYIKSLTGRKPYRFSHYGCSVMMVNAGDWERLLRFLGVDFDDFP